MIRALVEAGADLFAEDRAHATPFRIVNSLPDVRTSLREPLEQAYINIPDELWNWGERPGQQECRELLKELMDSALMTKSAVELEDIACETASCPIQKNLRLKFAQLRCTLPGGREQVWV
eukprot:CAMPEP_0175805872 /NCGR_PEP_ID=MMETSP0107_2-20121207/889_1 /TAXON_ID=195067 ORGANISM="Goniomonas pacifica, Strain CCMP1869" /NCGR_SAMPLE_ID=MMETSP0107_2 /ASSEMBLY_ACC=CAM_ASM_000203 /LENGTH=119 /DNA_ID=CAMNT_0017117325 /DNA_START=20 /DNA_END=380 /DNA_ORIENTATION=-